MISEMVAWWGGEPDGDREIVETEAEPEEGG